VPALLSGKGTRRSCGSCRLWWRGVEGRRSGAVLVGAILGGVEERLGGAVLGAVGQIDRSTACLPENWLSTDVTSCEHPDGTREIVK
jgi:hypothetical protein